MTKFSELFHLACEKFENENCSNAFLFARAETHPIRNLRIKKVATAIVTTWNNWRRHPDSNRRITVLQTVALPLGYAASGAGNGIRTRDFNLGKVALYR